MIPGMDEQHETLDRTAPSAGPEAVPPGSTMSVADYEEAMQDRNVHARARGLSAPYIAGGRDPDPEAGRAQERFYLRLLVAMVLLIVVGGLVLSIVVYVAGGGQ